MFSGLGDATVTFGGAGTLREEVEVRLDGWPVLAGERISVYREPSLEEGLARQALARLQEVDKALYDVLPILPRGQISMVLLPAERYDEDALYLPGAEWPLTVALKGGARDLESDDAKDFFYQLLPHEWTETPIGSRLYWRDRNMRWFGDGLAEYAAFATSARLAPASACARFESYLQLFTADAGGSYNLEDFSVASIRDLRGLTEAYETRMARGYAASFAIFYALATIHGEAYLDSFTQTSLGWLWPPGRRVREGAESMLRGDQRGGERFTSFTDVPHAWIVGQIREAQQQTCTLTNAP